MKPRYTITISLIVAAFLGLSMVVRSGFANIAATCDTSGITVTDADAVRCETTTQSGSLLTLLSQATARIIKVYADGSRFISLEPLSGDMTAALDTAAPRPIFTYLDANRYLTLTKPSNAFTTALNQVADRVYIRHADASRQVVVLNYPSQIIVDATPPQISQLQATTTGGGSSVTISWQTNEFATGRVLYGTDIGNLDQEITNNRYTQSHTMVIPDVTVNTTYYYRVSSQDRNGNDVFSGGIESVTVTPNAPTADFSSNSQSGIAPLSVNFSDLSTGATSWNWTFGDGNSSASQNPTHIYTEAGNYTVSLTVSNAGGSDVETKTGYIVVVAPPPPLPTADFTSDGQVGDSPLAVRFVDQSADATSWSWSFGDGSSSTSQHPTHIYTKAGTYTVSLTVSNPTGNDTETKVSYIEVTTAPTTNYPLYLPFLTR